jgi:hypothetical protein
MDRANAAARSATAPGRSRLPGAAPAAASLAALAILTLAMLAMVACGGKVLSPTEPPGGGPGAQAFTFAQIQAGIFTPSCAKAGCHASSAASGGLVLEAGLAYGNIVGRAAPEAPQLDFVRPGNPEASYLLKKVRGDADISGSRMPRDGPPFLTPQQIAGLAAWIQAGAPDN